MLLSFLCKILIKISKQFRHSSKKQMGNICCSEGGTQKSTPKVMVKSSSLRDPRTRKEYEKTLEYILNQALEKFYEKYHIRSLKLKGLIGKGGQASVFQVDVLCMKDGEKVVRKFAMKRVSKHRLDKQKAKEALLLEKQILVTRPSPFITEVEFACQDQSYLYFFMKLAQGGDSYSLIKQQEKYELFSPSHESPSDAKVKLFKQKGESAVIFILAAVILGIESLHNLNVIYRDLKPENILLFEDGYPKLADFGVATRHDSEDELCYEMKGTVLYFAPEMIKKKGYDRGVDLWSLGVLAYEFILHQPPFASNIIKSPIFEKKIQERTEKNFWPPETDISENMKDFINKLLVANPHQRLGYSSFDDIKKHPLFESLDWQLFEERKLESPLKEIVDKHQIEIVQEKQIDEALDRQELGYIPFTYVRNTHEKIRTTREIIPTTFMIEKDSLNIKVTSESDSPQTSPIKPPKDDMEKFAL